MLVGTWEVWCFTQEDYKLHFDANKDTLQVVMLVHQHSILATRSCSGSQAPFVGLSSLPWQLSCCSCSLLLLLLKSLGSAMFWFWPSSFKDRCNVCAHVSILWTYMYMLSSAAIIWVFSCNVLSNVTNTTKSLCLPVPFLSRGKAVCAPSKFAFGSFCSTF